MSIHAGRSRVLGLAQRELPPQSESRSPGSGPYYAVERIEKDLTFLGLMAMMDPPRPEVARAVKNPPPGWYSDRDDHRRLWPDC